MNFSKEELAQMVVDHGPWFHNIPFPHDIFTNPNRPNNPKSIWQSVSKFLPKSLIGVTVLDVGCNGGYMEIQLERLGCVVDAIDINPLYIQQTELVKKVFDLNCKVFQADICKNNLIGQYDIVLLSGVIYHVDNMIGALQNALHLSKGTVIIETDFNLSKESIIDFMNYDVPYLYRFRPSLSALSKMIEYCGGKITNTDIWCPGPPDQKDGHRATFLITKK